MRLIPWFGTLLILQAVGTAAPRRIYPQATVSSTTPSSLRYDRVGTGEPLLLLHGFGGCAATWQPLAGELADTYELIIPDLPGHGGSPRPAGAYSHRQNAASVNKLIDSLQLKHVRAIGISSGGMTLLHAAIQRPELYQSIIIVGATYTFPPEARAILRGTKSLDDLPPPVRAGWVSCAHGDSAQLAWLVQQFNGTAARYDDMNLEPSDLRAIRARLLIVHGDRDPFFPVTVPAAIRLAVPTSALWVVPFGDHVPLLYDGRQASFVSQAKAFLAAP